MLYREGDLHSWLGRAQPGEREAYGRGERPPAELVRAMRPFVDSGAIAPLSKREAGGFLFLIERRDGPLARQKRASRGRVRSPRVRRSALSRVFACLVEAARHGRACPTNTELAQRCGLSGKQSASYRLQLLAKNGRIAIASGDCGEARTVTILTGRHAGKSTR